MRAVLDTNVLLSGLIWHGTPHTLVEHIRGGRLGLISSPSLIAELAEVLSRQKFRRILALSRTDPALLLVELRTLAEIIDAPPLPKPVSRDPDDDIVLAVAAAAHADLIVSGDHDLLVLGRYAGMPIVTPAAAIDRLAS